MIRPLLAALMLGLPMATAKAATWTVDPARSSITFAGTATGAAFTGRFKTFAAIIDFDPKDPASGHALVTVDTGSATTGDPQKDDMLPGEDFFETGRFPKAVFETTGFKALGGDRYEADGMLTIRDIKAPITLPFTLAVTGEGAHAVGTVPLLRQLYGIGRGAWAADDTVAFAVDVTIDLVAARKP